MLAQWHSPRTATTAPSESVYSQPTPSRTSMLRPFSGMTWILPGRSSNTNSTPLPHSPTTTASEAPPMLPPLRIGPRRMDTARSPVSRSPSSVRSVIDPASSPPTEHGQALSPFDFGSSEQVSPIQAPARVLDYGGNVSLDSPFAAQSRRLGSRHGSRNHTRHPSQRSQRSHRSQRSVRSYEARNRGVAETARRRGPRWIPKHSKGKVLFPAMKHAAVRTKFLHTVVSGGLLVLILIIFLALLGAQSQFTQEFRIIAILFMLVFTVLFAHSIIRLVMIMLRIKKHGTLSRSTSTASQQSYARPTQPIMVTLARDEELGIGGTPDIGADDGAKQPPPPPPAYGLWRGSVRVDPNLVHWQRVEPTENTRPISAGTIRRPPSYDGTGESPDVQIERQILEEQRNAARDRDNAARWRPSILPQPRVDGSRIPPLSEDSGHR